MIIDPMATTLQQTQIQLVLCAIEIDRLHRVLSRNEQKYKEKTSQSSSVGRSEQQNQFQRILERVNKLESQQQTLQNTTFTAKVKSDLINEQISLLNELLQLKTLGQLSPNKQIQGQSSLIAQLQKEIEKLNIELQDKDRLEEMYLEQINKTIDLEAQIAQTQRPFAQYQEIIESQNREIIILKQQLVHQVPKRPPQEQPQQNKLQALIEDHQNAQLIQQKQLKIINGAYDNKVQSVSPQKIIDNSVVILELKRTIQSQQSEIQKYIKIINQQSQNPQTQPQQQNYPLQMEKLNHYIQSLEEEIQQLKQQTEKQTYIIERQNLEILQLQTNIYNLQNQKTLIDKQGTNENQSRNDSKYIEKLKFNVEQQHQEIQDLYKALETLKLQNKEENQKYEKKMLRKQHPRLLPKNDILIRKVHQNTIIKNIYPHLKNQLLLFIYVNILYVNNSMSNKSSHLLHLSIINIFCQLNTLSC